jgi:hypothetical protein
MPRNPKIFLVMLLGAAISLSACGSQRSLRANPSPVPPSSLTAQLVSDRIPAERQNYQPISLAQFAPNALVGTNPKAIALSAFGNIESEGGSQGVTVDYPQRDRAIVTITQTGVADDSIGAIRYRVELQQNPTAQAGKPWKILWAGSQVKCHPERGHQDWSTERCL